MTRPGDAHLRTLLAEKLGDEAADRLIERLPEAPAKPPLTQWDLADVRTDALKHYSAVAKALTTQTLFLTYLFVVGIAIVAVVAARAS